MLHCESADVVYERKHIPFWLLSAFKAGFINSAGFLITGEFVSHVTGFGSRVGITIGHEDYAFGIELLIIPISFIFGGVVTSYILDKDYSDGKAPSYFKVQGFITFLIAIVIAMGESDLINANEQFGSDGHYTGAEFSLLALLVFICGLKNSLVAWTTYGKIRVTHLTGLSTDIGLNLLRTLGLNKHSPRFKESKKINIVRMLIFICFSTGAFISAYIFPQIGFKGFFIVFFISSIMTVISFFDSKARTIHNSDTRLMN